MIRKAWPADSRGIYEACIASIRAGGGTHYSPEQVEAWVQRISESSFEKKIPHLDFLVAESADSKIVGFAALNPTNRELEYIYVHPDKLKTGLGRRLIEAIEARANIRRVRRLHLVGSLNAVGFYELMGYRTDRTFVRDLNGVQIPCTMMSKEL